MAISSIPASPTIQSRQTEAVSERAGTLAINRRAERTRDDPAVLPDDEGRRRTPFGDEAVLDHPNLGRAHLDRGLFGEDLGEQRDRFDIAAGPARVRHGHDFGTASAERARDDVL